MTDMLLCGESSWGGILLFTLLGTISIDIYVYHPVIEYRILRGDFGS
jgi:hypothetical protein